MFNSSKNPPPPTTKNVNSVQYVSYDGGNTWIDCSQQWTAQTATTSSAATSYFPGPSLIHQIKALEERIAHLEARTPNEPPETPTIQQVRETSQLLKRA